MKHTTVIFALEGGLLDTLDDLTTAVNYVLKKWNYPERTKEEVAEKIGAGMGPLIRKCVPKGTTWEQSWDLIEPCTNYYAENATEKTKPYDGILDLIKELKAMGINIATISDKSQEVAEKQVKEFFGDDIKYVYGASEDIKRKPSPDLIFKIMDDLKLELNDVLYVGGEDTDIQTAKNAGVDGVVVTWGFKTKYYLENHAAKTIIDTPNELLKLL